jgi:hypothetical protein
MVACMHAFGGGVRAEAENFTNPLPIKHADLRLRKSSLILTYLASRITNGALMCLSLFYPPAWTNWS